MWGNPTYRWDAMRAQGYAWWIQRLERSCELYDYVRLDHFLGFANFFSIPLGHTAKDGWWRVGPGRELFERAHEKLGDLPFVAEDLGVITPTVRTLVESCGFPGMDVVQFCDYDPKPGYEPEKYGAEGARDTARAMLLDMAASSADVFVCLLQDAMLLDDSARMNVPGVASGNWSWQATWKGVEGALELMQEIAGLR